MSFIPNTTPTPNWLYNGEMKKMNETELKVVLLVTRKTLGWFDPMTLERKTQDNISQSQFMEFTGKSHTAIAQAIQSSVKNGWIIAKDREGNLCNASEKRRRRKVWYQLGNVFINKISKQQSGQDENLSNISVKSKQHNASNLSNKVDNTKVTITKETNTKDKQGKALQISNGKEINELIELFKSINPSYERLFSNKTQREAMIRLFSKLGREKLEQIITILSKTNKVPFSPTITTPYELEMKLAALMAFISKEKIKVEQAQEKYKIATL